MAPDPEESEEEAFRRAYAELAPALFAWARARIRPELRTWIEPADVVQEVWCRAWSACAEGGELRELRPWLFGVAKNVLLEALRRARSPAFRAAAGGSTTRLVALGGVPDEVTAVSVRCSRDEHLARFSTWLEQLADEDRDLVVLCGLEGLGHAEVGERLGISRDAAAKRWQRLRARLEEERLPRDLLAVLR
ncbi:MAG TPA: sigma-70 family RNA polymerase sigma factor [Planctomycetota bacterium]|nr:sigma-70 family RNA polymerase sigma factor [Planctomycetota bacterium]